MRAVQYSNQYKAKLKDIVDGKITSDIAGDLSRAATTAQFTKTVEPRLVRATSVTANITNENQLGLYMAIIDPADKDTVYNPVFASADYNTDGKTNSFNVPLSSASYSDSAAAKKSKLDLDKTAKNDNDYNGDGGDTAAVGDVLTFTVTTTIPGYGKTFDHPQFVLKDVMTDLELQPGTITVTAEELDAGEYKILDKAATEDKETGDGT